MNFRDLFKINWRYRTYHVWIVNTNTDCKLYLWNNWQQLLPFIDSLVKLTEQPAFIRTFQSMRHQNKWLGFGRMKWDTENNIKWATKYRTGNTDESKLEFFNTEIWAPDWNKVCDTDMPPDVFINLYGPIDFNGVGEGLVICLPVSTYKRNQVLIDTCLSNIVSLIPDATISVVKRDWWGRTAKRNNIEDMSPHEMQAIIDGR